MERELCRKMDSNEPDKFKFFITYPDILEFTSSNVFHFINWTLSDENFLNNLLLLSLSPRKAVEMDLGPNLSTIAADLLCQNYEELLNELYKSQILLDLITNFNPNKIDAKYKTFYCVNLRKILYTMLSFSSGEYFTLLSADFFSFLVRNILQPCFKDMVDIIMDSTVGILTDQQLHFMIKRIYSTKYNPADADKISRSFHIIQIVQRHMYSNDDLLRILTERVHIRKLIKRAFSIQKGKYFYLGDFLAQQIFLFIREIMSLSSNVVGYVAEMSIKAEPPSTTECRLSDYGSLSCFREITLIQHLDFLFAPNAHPQHRIFIVKIISEIGSRSRLILYQDFIFNSTVPFLVAVINELENDKMKLKGWIWYLCEIIYGDFQEFSPSETRLIKGIEQWNAMNHVIREHIEEIIKSSDQSINASQ